MPVGYVMLVRRPSLSYLEDGRQHKPGGEELQKVLDSYCEYLNATGGQQYTSSSIKRLD